MPNLDIIPVPTITPLTPYNHIADQMPIDALKERIDIVNNEVDNNSQILRESIGSSGTLSARLAKSIKDDGTIKTIAIDNCLHSIAKHIDGDGFVRMRLDERNKLSFISPNANKLVINVQGVSQVINFDSGEFKLRNSDTVNWRVDNGNVYADSAFPANVRHTHYYGIIPTHINISSPNYKNYKTTTNNQSYRSNSLRIYVNGIRLNKQVNTTIIRSNSTVNLTYSESDNLNGLFELSQSILSSDVIIIDFDVNY